MANPKKRVPENVPGDFLVDSTCNRLRCVPADRPSHLRGSRRNVFRQAQPQSSAERRQALQALLACPTGSIGCLGQDDVKAVMKGFPLVIEEPVFYCGYNSPKSYGGNSYFIRHPAGNWLIDSPKFVTPLVQQLEALGVTLCVTRGVDGPEVWSQFPRSGTFKHQFGAGLRREFIPMDDTATAKVLGVALGVGHVVAMRQKNVADAGGKNEVQIPDEPAPHPGKLPEKRQN